MMEKVGCSNHYCFLTGKAKGVATNAGCTCLYCLPFKDRAAIERRIRSLEGAIKSALSLEAMWINCETRDDAAALSSMRKQLESIL